MALPDLGAAINSFGAMQGLQAQKAERDYLNQQREQQAAGNAALQDLKNRYAQTQDPELLRQIIIQDVDSAAKIRSQFGAIDQQTTSDKLNKAATLKQMIERDPQEAASFFQSELAGDPAFDRLIDNFQTGDMTGALDDISFTVTALGGQEAYDSLFGDNAQDMGASQREFESLISGFSPEEQEKARRVKAGLEARAVGKAPTIAEYAGKKYMQEGNSLTPITISADGQSYAIAGDPTTVDAIAAEQPTQVSPEDAAQEEIRLKAAEAQAIAEAKQAVVEGSQESVDREAKKEIFRLDTVGVLDSLLESDLGAVTGVSGRLPTLRPSTEDMLVKAQRLESLLTADNLGMMTGVLSETDMKIISALSAGFGLEKDSEGNPIRVKGTEEELRSRFGTLKKGLVAIEVVPQLESEIPEPSEGMTVKDNDSGFRFKFQNGEWKAL